MSAEQIAAQEAAREQRREALREEVYRAAYVYELLTPEEKDQLLKLEIEKQKRMNGLSAEEMRRGETDLKKQWEHLVHRSNSEFWDEAARGRQDGKKEFRRRLRDNYLADAPISPEDYGLILRGGYRIGFTPAAVRASLGDPDRVRKTITADGTSEVWIYGNSRLYFEQGTLNRIETSE